VTSGKKFISITRIPAPWQVSHRPPFTLKLNLPGLYPLIMDSGVWVNRLRISLNTPVYVAGLDLGVRPMGDWLMSITLSIFFSPLILVYGIGFLTALKKCAF